MGQFLNSLNDVRKNYKKYDSWEQKQADERAKKEYLANNISIPNDKIELTKKRAETVIRATEIMDARSEDNCQNVEQLTGMISSIPTAGLLFLQNPLIKFFSNKFNSKTQAKIEEIKKELENISLAQDQRILKLEELKKLYKKSNKINVKVSQYTSIGVLGVMLLSTIGMILWGNSKQKEASRIGRFQAKQNNLKDEKNFVIYTPEQIEKAKEIAKNIPDEKEKNSISKMMKEMKELSKDKAGYKAWYAQKDLEEIEKLKSRNLSPEQLQRAEEDKELIVDTVKEINIKAEEYSENVENAFDTFGMLSWLIAAPLGFGINKIMKFFKATKALKGILSTAISVSTPLVISFIGTLEEKKSSRVGRYKARQDLMKNPSRLMAYSQEDMKKAENITANKQKQTFFQKLGSSFSFLKNYYKDKKEYNKYKKTTQKENEKLQKALVQLEVSAEQKEEAKALQKNVFRTFDEIDEMSQRYSEDVEAGTDIAKQLGSTVWSLGSILGLAYLTASVVKGKFPIAKLANWITNLTFDSKSSIKIAMNNFMDVVKKTDKKTVRQMQKDFVSGDLKYFMNDPKNKALKDAMEPLLNEFKKLGNKTVESGITQAASGKMNSLDEVALEVLKSHLKQTALAKWTRKMIAQCVKLWAKSKVDIPVKAQEQLGMNFNYKNYKTLINTGIAAGIPVLGIIFAVPYSFNAWLTNIQKKAGKIGIMKAMDKIDDPRVFASELKPQSEENIQNSNLLAKFK